MPNIFGIKRRLAELAAEATKASADLDSGAITQKQFAATVSAAWAEHKDLIGQEKAYSASLQFAGLDGASGAPHQHGLRHKAAQAAPLGWSEDQLRQMFASVQTRQSFQLKTKGFASVNGLLPAELQPLVVGPQYEDRLLDRLPILPTSAPALEYIRHNSTTGAPGITAEGAAKPELIFVTDSVTVTAKKLAAHAGLSWESLSDFDSFQSYVTGELQRQVINVENSELISGDGTATHLTGFLATSGILTATKGADTDLDAVEKSIAAMRVGAALATANVVVVHPSTFSALRRSKDSQGRYLLNSDPSAAEANSLWGIDAVVTTQITAGTALLLDTRKVGFVVVRESLTLRTGTDSDDFTRNLVRFVAEERLNLAVERPSAALKLTGLTAS
jgi:HK97 family phage major capsid protein